VRGIIGAAGALALAAAANSANAATMCFGFSDENPEAMKTGRIVGQGPAKFQDAPPSECKTVGGSCSTNSRHVAPGERIVVFNTKDGYVCAEAPTAWRSPPRWGWLPASRVRIDPPTPVTPDRWWVGVWSMPFETITITLNRTELDGTAESAVEDGAGRTAEFDGPLTRVENHLSFIDTPSHYRCEVQLSRMGSALAVSDNGRCGNGGRLFGIYHRQ
jgi:hypothetical protein